MVIFSGELYNTVSIVSCRKKFLLQLPGLFSAIFQNDCLVGLISKFNRLLCVTYPKMLKEKIEPTGYKFFL